MTIKNPFKYFKTSPEIIRLAVMYYVRYLAAEPSVCFPPKLKVLLYCSEGLLPALRIKMLIIANGSFVRIAAIG